MNIIYNSIMYINQNITTYIVQQQIQKGFTKGVSGALECTSMMGHSITKAHLKQRSVGITLLDLNLCFNIFMQLIKQEKYVQLGFSPPDASDRLYHPIHWFQFPDDTAVVTSDEQKTSCY